MSPASALSLLKILSLILAGASAPWGLTRRTTFDDGEGKRRLTPAGYVSLLIILGSLIVGVTSFGFETLVEQNQADEARRRDAEARAANAQKVATELQREGLRRAEAAEINGRLLDQRLLALNLAAKEQQLGLANSRLIEAGAKANLTRTQDALTQIDRVLNPASNIFMSVVWKLPGPLVLGQGFQAKITQRSVEDVCPDGTSIFGSAGEDRSYEVSYDSCVDKLSDLSLLRSTIQMARPEVSIFSRRSRDGLFWAIAADRDGAKGIGRGAGDLDFSVWALPDQVGLDLHGDGAGFRLGRTISETSIVRSGRIVSVRDLDGATIVVAPSGDFRSPKGFPATDPYNERDRLRLTAVELRIGGRDIEVDAGSIRTLHTKHGSVFVVGPLRVAY